VLLRHPRCVAPLRRRATPCITKAIGIAGDEGETKAGIEAGTKVKVTKSVKIYHMPKRQDGLDLQGFEGTVQEVITEYQGKPLTANCPYKIQFLIPKDDGKDQKLISHLKASEIEAVA
jgi:hypothetical protein